jgi:hypothetical protein
MNTVFPNTVRTSLGNESLGDAIESSASFVKAKKRIFCSSFFKKKKSFS